MTAGCAPLIPRPRRSFAQDLLNLTLAGPGVNRYQKRAHDAAEWRPPENKCWFAARVVAVRCVNHSETVTYRQPIGHGSP